MKQIHLTQGKVALVDDEDYEYLNQFKWHAHYERGRWYAIQHICKNGKDIFNRMHRVILNTPKGMETDHIDGDGLNNQRFNLRAATKAQNHQNLHMLAPNKVSSFKGVSLNKGGYSWRAYININGKYFCLGSSCSEIKAALTYDEAAKKYFGEFARLNFIEV